MGIGAIELVIIVIVGFMWLGLISKEQFAFFKTKFKDGAKEVKDMELSLREDVDDVETIAKQKYIKKDDNKEKVSEENISTNDSLHN